MTATMQQHAGHGSKPDAGRINALLGQLRDTTSAVTNKSWVSPEIAGDQQSSSSMDALGSTGSPLSTLDSSGMGFLTPMVSFLDEPLGQLRGNPGSVSSSAGEFDGAAKDAQGVAGEYKSTAGSQTSQWSGQAKTDYTKTGTELIDGILSIAETSLTSAKSMIGAGEVISQVVTTVTQLIGEAVGKIVPIMSKAIAEAPATFGQSIAAAIPQCVGIATDYAGRIAGKLGALLSSGENLMKLIDGALGVVKIVKEVMSVIGKQSQGGSSSSDSSTSAGGDTSADGQSTSSTPTSNMPTSTPTSTSTNALTSTQSPVSDESALSDQQPGSAVESEPATA